MEPAFTSRNPLDSLHGALPRLRGRLGACRALPSPAAAHSRQRRFERSSPRRGARISPAFKAMRPESTSNHAVKRGVIRGKRKTPILQYSNTPLGRIRGRGRFCAGAWREQNRAAQLRRWIGAGAGRKIFYANLLVNALDPGRARCLADIADGEGCDSAARAGEVGSSRAVTCCKAARGLTVLGLARCLASRTTDRGDAIPPSALDPAAAGQPPAHFHRNPPGGGQLAVFLPPRRITPYVSIQICSSLVPVRLAPP